MLNPVVLAIVSVYTDRQDRARAIGEWESAIGITLAAGPIFGGVLLCGEALADGEGMIIRRV